MRFWGLKSQYLQSLILQHETCPWRCCVYSVIHPFLNSCISILSLCLPPFWPCAFPVSILTSCLAGISPPNHPWDTRFSLRFRYYLCLCDASPSGAPKCSRTLHDWTISRSWQGCSELPQHLRPQNMHHHRLCGTRALHLPLCL